MGVRLSLGVLPINGRRGGRKEEFNPFAKDASQQHRRRRDDVVEHRSQRRRRQRGEARGERGVDGAEERVGVAAYERTGADGA